MGRMVTIRLTKMDEDFGEIAFELEDEQSATGTLRWVKVPSDRPLRVKIETWLRENPESLSVFGGYAPDDISGYGDGILAVLNALAPMHRFDVDWKSIPLPTFPEGAVG